MRLIECNLHKDIKWGERVIFLYLLRSLLCCGYFSWKAIIVIFIGNLVMPEMLEAAGNKQRFYPIESIINDFEIANKPNASILNGLEIIEHRLSHLKLSEDAKKELDIFSKAFSKGDFDLAFKTPRNQPSFRDQSASYFYFHGIPSHTDYSVYATPLLNLHDNSFLEGPFNLSLGFHRKKKSQNPHTVYDLYGKGYLYTGAFTKQHMLRFFDSITRFLSYSNLVHLINDKDTLLETKLKSYLRHKLPHFMPFFEQYVSFTPSYKTNEISGQKRLLLNFQLKQKRLKKHYRYLAGYFENLSKRADIKIEQISKLGAFGILYKLSINFKTLSLTYRIDIDEAKIITHHNTKKTNITKKKAFTVYDITKHPISIGTHIDIDFLGLKLEGIKVKSRLADKSRGGKYYSSLKLTDIKTPKFSGAAFGIISVGVIDTFIPGSLAKYFQTFTKTLLTADNGYGSHIDVLSEQVKLTETRKTNTINWQLSASFLDNFFLQRGLAIINHLFIPKQNAFEDIRRISIKSVQLLQKDVATLTQKTKPISSR